MAQKYLLTVSSPKNAAGPAKTWEFSPESGVVVAIRTQIKKEHREISTLTATIFDPSWVIANALPDPGYQDIPVILTMPRPGDERNLPVVVFDGILTEIAPAHLPSMLQLVAHDRSIKMRRDSRYKAYANKSSTQIAATIAKDYGLTVEVDTGDITVKTRPFDIGAGENMSDWDHLARALAADGLEAHVKGTVLTVRQKAQVAFPVTFRRGDPVILAFQPKILHVAGPGKGGDVRTNEVGVEERNGTTRAVIGPTATATAKEGAGQRTHQKPMGLALPGTHKPGSPWTNTVDLKRRRKDTATLKLTPYPDIGLQHTIVMDGFGGKFDGEWHIDTIEHDIAAQAARGTSLMLKRSTSKGAKLGQSIDVEAR